MRHRLRLNMKARDHRELLFGLTDALMEVKNALAKLEGPDDELVMCLSLDEISFDIGQSPFGYTLEVGKLEEA